MLKVVENRKYFIGASIGVLLIGLIFIIINVASHNGAFNYDVEFSGGTSFQIDIGQPFNNDDIMKIVQEVTGQEAPQIQQVSGANQVMIRMRSVDQETRTTLIQDICEKYGITVDAFTYQDISPTVSSDMKTSAILAVVCACAAMLIYVSFRFRNISMGAAAITALLHDSLIMVAFYGMLRIPLNYTFIAAVLTILGYSINSTIVIFDRVRENKSIMRKVPQIELINVSITQTMRRSIFTTLTVVIVVLVLYILGVSAIKEFTLPILIGVIAGAYSSIFLAGTLWYIFSGKQEVSTAGSSTARAAAAPKPVTAVQGAGSSAGNGNNGVRQLSSTRRKKNKRK